MNSKLEASAGFEPAVEVVQPANCGLPELSGVAVAVAFGRNGSDTGLGALGYTFTRSPDAADLSIAAMTSCRRTASAKSGTL